MNRDEWLWKIRIKVAKFVRADLITRSGGGPVGELSKAEKQDVRESYPLLVHIPKTDVKLPEAEWLGRFRTMLREYHDSLTR